MSIGLSAEEIREVDCLADSGVSSLQIYLVLGAEGEKYVVTCFLP